MSKELFKNTIKFSLTALVLWELSNFSAKAAKRTEVRERAGGSCEICGIDAELSKQMFVGHINHTHGDGYNSTGNLVYCCLSCEAEHHIAHADDPSVIGLTKKVNDPTAWGHFVQLSSEEQERLNELYPGQMAGIIKRLT